MAEDVVATTVGRATNHERAGEEALARDLLSELVGVVTKETPADLIRRCVRMSSRVGAPDLSLHFALHYWSACRGTPPGRRAVIQAAHEIPELRAVAERIAVRAGDPRDWCTIAAADRHADWPSIQALGPGGSHEAVDPGDMEESGAVRRDMPDGSGLWRVRDARATGVGSSSAVGAWSEALGGHRYVPGLSTGDCSAAFSWSEDSQPVRRGGRMALVATTITFSTYWHWLVEGLLQVVRLDELGCIAELDEVVIHTDPDPPPYLVDSLEAAGLDSATVHVVSEPFDLLVDELVVPKLHRAAGAAVAGFDRTAVVPQRRKLSRAALQYVDALRDRVGASGRRRGEGNRLYVSRRDAVRRRITNEPALESALRGQGFDTVVAGELSFSEQVTTFRDADVIVAPHGAALANLAFGSPGAAVLELQHAKTERTFYSEVAERVGIQYASMVCDVDPESPEDMVVDVDAVVAATKALRDVR